MKIYLLFLLIVTSVYAGRFEKVSLQLMWLHQFQFAGYYISKEKGFYKKAGLEVEIREFKSSADPLKAVLNDRATFGIGRSNLIRHYSPNKSVVLLSSIFQSSPLVLLSLRKDINAIKDFEGKKIMMTEDAVETVSLHAMINSNNINKDMIEFIDSSFDIKDLIDGNVDLYAGYISNEPYFFKKQGIEYKVFSPKDYGFDFYSDILFTSKKTLNQDPEMVKRFNDASLKGWKYAFEHIDESVDIIYQKYNSQNKTKDALRFEAQELKQLAYQNNTELGDIDRNKIERIFDIYKVMGLVKGYLDLDSLIYNKQRGFLTKEQEEYLKSKRNVHICVWPDSPPYSIVEKGEYLGIGSQILKLTQNSIDVEYKLVDSKSWIESVNKGLNSECDLFPIASKTKNRDKLFNYTTPYHSEPLVIVTKKEKNYIVDFHTIADKKFSIVKGHAFIEQLKEKYPKIDLEYVNSTHEGIVGVDKGDYYGHIDLLVSAAYELKHHTRETLQISGQFGEKVDIGFAVRKDDKILFEIYEKISKELKPSELQKLLDDWVKIDITNTIDFKYKKEVFFLTLFMFILFLYRQHILKKKNDELELLKGKLEELNHSLESKIHAATHDLEIAQDVAKIGSWVFDLKNNDLRWSNQTYKIFDINPHDDDLYMSFIDRIHPEDREMVENTYYQSIEDKKIYRLEHRLRMDDGSIKYVLESCETIYDDNGSALISYGTVQDITEATIKRVEIKKKELEILHKSRLIQMGEMLSMIAHQWKQPLSSISTAHIAIVMAIEMNKYDLEDKTQREEFLEFLHERLERISKHVKNLSQVISDFSDFYKPNKKSEVLKVNDVLLKAGTLFSDSLSSAGIEFAQKINSDDHIHIHENEFIQVILNIVMNAKEQLVDKNIDNPRIFIESYSIEDDVFIDISDNAGGIDNDIINKLFDPYFSTKFDKNGTGLGLYMSKTIIKDYHKGDIFVKNGDDGAVFTIKIKRYEREEDE